MKIIIFSGAGISAESGISTFRDSNGLWENHKIEDVCTFSTWKKNRELVFKFYNERRLQLASVVPNRIHYAIAELQENNKTIHLTQNVDNLSTIAGGKSVIHLHGELTKMLCTHCGHTWDIGYYEASLEDRCSKCDSVKSIKPMVVFFGESAPEYKKLYSILASIKKDDIFLMIGTSNNVIDIVGAIRHLKCKKILCNLEKLDTVDEKVFDHIYYGKGTENIDKIVEMIQQQLS